jgi:CRP-like cAMP-binding protein
VLAPQPAGAGREGLVPIATVAAGEPLGEVSFFTDRPREVSIRAGNAPVRALVFDAVHFESLLQQSSEFSRGLLREMAVKIVGLYERAGRQDEAPQPVRP